jgi:hypothetical protein
MTEPVVIHIQHSDEFSYEPNQYYYVYYGYPPTLLLGPTQTPYISAAQELIALGYDPNRKLLMRRRGVNVNQLNYTIHYASMLGVEDEQQPDPAAQSIEVGPDP